MTRNVFLASMFLLCTIAAAQSTAHAQTREQQIVQSSSTVLDEIMAVPLRSIPRAMLEDAAGIAIIPNVIKASFVVGGRHGAGVLLIRTDEGDWRLPVFIKLTGGNIGWQAGVQATDLILVFKTSKSVQGILNGKLTLGADAAAAAGPIGRQASAATDERLQAEIYSYSRSRGLFAGVSIDGSVLRVAPDMNALYYGPPGASNNVDPAAVQLAAKVAAYCAAKQPAPTGAIPADPLPQAANDAEAERLRAKLAQAGKTMAPLLNTAWSNYLALPAETYQGGAKPNLDTLRGVLARYDLVARSPQYRVLAERAEFQAVYDLLRRFERSLSNQQAALQLPPPPEIERR